MRKYLIYFALLLVGCGGDGGSLVSAPQADEPVPQPVQHAPEIAHLSLSPSTVTYMDGNGGVGVTAQFEFTDVGLDIQSLRIDISDGTSLTIAPSEPINSASGTIAEEFEVSTNEVGELTVEISLVDSAGDSSNHLTAVVRVESPVPEITMLDPVEVRSGSSGFSLTVTGTDFLTGAIVMWNGADRMTEYVSDTQVVATIPTEDLAAPDTVSVRVRNPDPTAGASNELSFVVVGNVQTGDWTKRLSVPLPLLDVVWDGQVFVAVGYGGTILTSVDGIDWVARESVSDDVLVGLVAVGSDIYAVGGAGILLSTDHGETWTVIGRPYGFIGISVAASSSRIVALGTVPDLGIPLITVSEDFGDTWETWEVSWGTSDLIYRDGLFVTPSGRGVRVSTDGKQWSEIVVDDANTEWNDVVAHDDSKFFVVSRDGTIFSSFDAFNWTELSAPLAGVFFRGAAWNGTRLILAGGVDSYQDRRDGTYRPIGIGSNDGGGSWDTFGIDRSYVSEGIAWGNGRFVSVGTLVVSDEGAIYTTD